MPREYIRASLVLRCFASRSQRSKRLEWHWQTGFSQAQLQVAQHGPGGGRVENRNAAAVQQRIQKCYGLLGLGGRGKYPGIGDKAQKT